MDKPETDRPGRARLLYTIAKDLFQYALVPFLLLVFLAKPVMDAARRSDPDVWGILLAALGAVGLNWYAYSAFRRKRPALPVFAHGLLCIESVLVIEYAALPGTHPLTSALAVIGGFLALASLLLFSFWLASCRAKQAHAAAVCIWVLLGIVLCAMTYRAVRDFESRRVTPDTWLTLGSAAALALGAFSPKILSARRRAALRRRATEVAAGVIVQIIGETRFDSDDDLETRQLARVRYAAGDSVYEARADISAFTVRRYGKPAFIGREVPVRYDPENPVNAYVDRIDRHLFDADEEE